MGVAADPAIAMREQFMRRALEQARRSLAAGGPPVGAVLVRDGQVVAEAANAVIPQLDVTAHAEIMAIRQACGEYRQLQLNGAELYVTVEPCLMCYAACSYAAVDAVYFGASIEAMQVCTGRELPVGEGCDIATGPVMTGGLLAADCTALLQEWGRLAGVAGA